jgi:ElaB/YqjD/DUF883 family membrane-anchored ribosome-binding protein
MAKKDETDKKFDPEKTLVNIMNEIEKGLNATSEKLKDKREEIEKKGLETTIDESAEKIKAGSKAIMEQVDKDVKKLRKNVEEMLKDL